MHPTREQVAQVLYDHDERKRNRLSPLPWAAETDARRKPYLERADAVRALYGSGDASSPAQGAAAAM